MSREKATHELLQKRQLAYHLSLNAPGVKEMLADLERFCRAIRMPEGEDKQLDPTRLAILVGRQQVWERIQHHFNLSTEQLYLLYTGTPFVVTGEDNAS